MSSKPSRRQPSAAEVELEDRPWGAADAGVVETFAGDGDPFLTIGGDGAEGETRLADEDGGLLVGFAVRERIDKDDVARLCGGGRVFDSRELFVCTDLESGGGDRRLDDDGGAKQEGEEAGRNGHRGSPLRRSE